MRFKSASPRSGSPSAPSFRSDFLAVMTAKSSSSSPISFELYHGAIDDPATPEAVFAAIGKAAMAWSRLEVHLDIILFQVNKIAHSSELYREHPISFERKIKLLKSWFNKHPALSSHKSHMRTLTVPLREINKEGRNPLLHSVFGAYDPKTETLTFQNMRPLMGDTFQLKQFTRDLKWLSIFTKTVNQANEIASWISRDLCSPAGVARLQKR